jgi:pyroglutamyl-peptidase
MLPPMPRTVLLTSFDVWKTHQVSNSSDDLIHEIQMQHGLNEQVYLLRKLPVDFVLAPAKIVAEIEQVHPDVVVCCGMAERRSRLSIESNGNAGDDIYRTQVNLRRLVQDLAFTRISHAAGKFVCNHTYYSVLQYIQTKQLATNCIFVHVPVLREENRAAIVGDFQMILARLSSGNVQRDAPTRLHKRK